MATQEILRTVLSDLGLDVKQFSERINYPASKLYDIQRGKTIKLKDNLIGRILAIYPQYSKIWLMTGEGERYNAEPTKVDGKKSEYPSTPTPQLQETDDTTPLPSKIPDATTAYRRLPLVAPTAVAGFGNDNFAIAEADIKEYYVVPKFKYNRVDFMIELSGSSMYPKYNSGDVVACTILHDSSFIQWNKCHVIATREQGLLCKRIMPGSTNDFLKMISDNENYPPFEVPKDDITGIALVVGVIRLE